MCFIKKQDSFLQGLIKSSDFGSRHTLPQPRWYLLFPMILFPEKLKTKWKKKVGKCVLYRDMSSCEPGSIQGGGWEGGREVYRVS